MKIFFSFFSILFLIPITSKNIMKVKINLKIKVQILKNFNPLFYMKQIEKLKLSKKVIQKIKQMDIKFKKTHKEKFFNIIKDNSKKIKVLHVELITLILRKKKVEFYYCKLLLTYDEIFLPQGDDTVPIIIPIPIPEPPPRFKKFLNKEIKKYLI